MFRPYSYVPVGTAKIFSFSRDENIERQKCGEIERKVSGAEEEVLGNAHMSTWLLCEHSRNQQRDNQELCQRAGRNSNKTGATKSLER